MIELGKFQTLFVQKILYRGVYLSERTGEATTPVFLPQKNVPTNVQIGDEINVFVYRNAEGILIATTTTPKISIGELSVLTVVSIDQNGAFLDMGLDKDLFLPFKQQSKALAVGDSILVAMYVDKSGRLCATMKLHNYLRTDSPYQCGDWTTGTIFLDHKELGLFIAVDNQFLGMLPRQCIFDTLVVGDKIDVRIEYIHPDGKLMLTNRCEQKTQINRQSQEILAWLLQNNGIIPFTDKADPLTIREVFHMSKGDFKRAIGHLLKEEKITIRENCIERLLA